MNGEARTGNELRSDAETHRVIRGRRWRVSDPALDEPVRQLLVNELMDARRTVKSALGGEHTDALEAARRRVHDAKVALGERGPKWWEPMSPDDVDARSAAFIRAIGDDLGDLDATTARSHLRLE